jgi:DNA-binding IclR family transcriptional regulator
MTQKAKNSRSPGYKAPAIKKAFRILGAVAESPYPIGIVEISDRLGFSKSTTHGIVHALLREGALSQGPGSRKLYLGRLLAELLFSNGHQIEVVKLVQPVIDDIRNQINESVFFGIRIRNRVMITAIAEVSESLKISASVGTSLPLLAAALGKAFLAWETTERIKQIVGKDGLPRWTEKSIIDMNTYLSELEKVRRLGYAVDQEEYIPGISAVAVPVRNLWGLPMAIWVVGMSGNFGNGQIKRIAAISVAAARMLREHVDRQPSPTTPFNAYIEGESSEGHSDS